MPQDEIREPTYLLLTALASGPRHGYALLSEIESLSEGRVRLKPGSLYGALERLREAGLIAAHSTEVVDGRTRTYFTLTDRGGVVLDETTTRMERQAAAARQRRRHAARPAGRPTQEWATRLGHAGGRA